MNVETITETRKTAVKKWREYKNAQKVSDNPIYKDLAKVYNQVKCGRKVIDIYEAIRRGGVNDLFQPNLAIAQATSKTVICRYRSDGRVAYMNEDRSWRPLACDVVGKMLPDLDVRELRKRQIMKEYSNELQMEAPVPLIPPRLLPKKLLSDYYILWEVEEWKMVAPTDPWLLRRLTRNMFVVLGAWDLTPLERKVMNGRL